MKNIGKPNLIFDWSGVISDDLDVVLATYNEIFAIYGIPPLTREQFKNQFVLPYEIFCKNIIGGHAPLDELQDHFRRIYSKLTIPPVIINGVEDVLDRLKAQQIPMAVLSSHSFVSIENKRYFPDKRFFAKIYEDVPNKLDWIHILLEELQFDPDNTYFIGDMTHDIETGKAGGVHTVAVTTGYQSRRTLQSADPDHIIDHLREIFTVLNV
ncbi:MAG: HAD family hydrolase [Candidatus Auribacterota bacterium]|jgi:phosphoglycolate phosphatase-like HAD superfamily hydrolase|nr:HAD family hydrolase [Candidatus Auribacterota bacterium]